MTKAINPVLLLWLIIEVSTAGCLVAVQPQSPTYLGSRKVFDKNYNLGRSQYANVGEQIVRIKAYTLDRIKSQQLQAIDDFVISGGLISFSGKKGSYPVIGQVVLDNKVFTVINVYLNQGKAFGVLVSDDGSVYHKVLDSNNQIPSIYSFTVKPEGFKFVRLDNESVSAAANYLNFELIYAGTDGRSIFVTYREFTKDDLARPAFYQNLVYARDSDSLRFRDIQIKIHEVTSERIVYSILNDGLPPP